MRSPIRSDLFFGADVLRICHSRHLSPKLGLPNLPGQTIVQTPRSDQAPPDPLGARPVTHLTLCARRSRATTACGAAIPAGVVMPHLQEPGCGDIIAPGVVIEEAAITITAEASSLFPRGFEQKSTPRDRKVAESSAKTLGNSWLGTWNSDAFAKMPSKRLSGNFIARKSCWRTSHSE